MIYKSEVKNGTYRTNILLSVISTFKNTIMVMPYKNGKILKGPTNEMLAGVITCCVHSNWMKAYYIHVCLAKKIN
jgi:hypothetical protein